MRAHNEVLRVRQREGEAEPDVDRLGRQREAAQARVVRHWEAEDCARAWPGGLAAEFAAAEERDDTLRVADQIEFEVLSRL